jgi:hypothetical protein
MKFQPGNDYAKLGGRPRGARNKLARRFVEDLIKDWEEHGAAAIKIMRREDPVAYCRMFAGLVPREYEFTHTSTVDLTDAQLDQVEAMLMKAREQALLIDGTVTENEAVN